MSQYISIFGLFAYILLVDLATSSTTSITSRTTSSCTAHPAVSRLQSLCLLPLRRASPREKVTRQTRIRARLWRKLNLQRMRVTFRMVERKVIRWRIVHSGMLDYLEILLDSWPYKSSNDTPNWWAHWRATFGYDVQTQRIDQNIFIESLTSGCVHDSAPWSMIPPWH